MDPIYIFLSGLKTDVSPMENVAKISIYVFPSVGSENHLKKCLFYMHTQFGNDGRGVCVCVWSGVLNNSNESKLLCGLKLCLYLKKGPAARGGFS